MLGTYAAQQLNRRHNATSRRRRQNCTKRKAIKSCRLKFDSECLQPPIKVNKKAITLVIVSQHEAGLETPLWRACRCSTLSAFCTRPGEPLRARTTCPFEGFFNSRSQCKDSFRTIGRLLWEAYSQGRQQRMRFCLQEPALAGGFQWQAWDV